jgi:hypothetical protein
VSAATDYLAERQVRLHVFRLPDSLAEGYCFGGGVDVVFYNVDFFDAPWNIPREELIAFVKGKKYFDAARRFLIIAEREFPTLTFTIEPPLVGATP